MTDRAREPVTLGGFVAYFLRLGALGFGGPVALANAMRRDLVERRGWITAEEYEDGLALAAACPGPLAYQLGVYCGYVRFGVTGGLATAIAFGLPPFVIVTIAAALYVRFAENWQLRALFYGIAPVVVALIVKASWNLGRRTLRADRVAWAFAIVGCAMVVILETELALMFVLAGAVGAFVFAPARGGRPPRPPLGGGIGAGGPSPLPDAAEAAAPHSGGNHEGEKPMMVAAAAVYGTTSKLFLFFLKTGLLVFGSGLVIVPFLKAQVVDQSHWLTNRQFLDAVAIGMISPGPVVITATFVGYLMSGMAGATAATLGIFSGPVLLTVLATPVLLRYRAQPQLAGFVRGVGVTVVGVLVGTTYLVGKAAIGDWLTLVIALLSLGAIVYWKKLPEPIVILAGGIAGLIAYPILQPQWLLR
jgi:chromate transporter